MSIEPGIRPSLSSTHDHDTPVVPPASPHPVAVVDPDFELVTPGDHVRPGAVLPVAVPTPAAPAVPMPNHRPRWPLLLILVVILLAAGAWWLKPSDWTLPWEEPVGPLTASGTLEADEVLIGAEISGRIVGLVREGDSVAAGAPVAKLDDSLIQLQIRQANGPALQQLQMQAEKYQLTSPIGGIVTRVPVHVGEVAVPGQTLAAVADLAQLELTAYVLERDLGQVRVGQQVTVTADPFPGRAFRGVVTSTNPRAEFTPRNVQTQADRLNLVFGVRVRVENPDLALKPGMPADVTFSAP